MAKEKFILVSLKEEESKKLAQIVSNDTSRKVLDYLAEKEATESELAEKLNVPISTIHYNLQALVKGRLVEADEYHYSEKGKEVLHYKLANKYIIIAPKSTFGIKEKLKSILPVGLIALAGSFAVYFYDLVQRGGRLIVGVPQNIVSEALDRSGEVLADEMVVETEQAMGAVVQEAVAKAVPAAENLAQDSAAEAAPVIAEVGRGAVESFWQTFLQNPALWFLVGAVFTLILIIIVEYIRYKRQNR